MKGKAMITKMKNQGFKDQDRYFDLSGLDLFTSNNVNGVGKSAALEAFKLGLLGKIPLHPELRPLSRSATRSMKVTRSVSSKR